MLLLILHTEKKKFECQFIKSNRTQIVYNQISLSTPGPFPPCWPSSVLSEILKFGAETTAHRDKMERMREDMSGKEEGELSDDGDDVDLKVVDEWTPETMTVDLTQEEYSASMVSNAQPERTGQLERRGRLGAASDSSKSSRTRKFESDSGRNRTRGREDRRHSPPGSSSSNHRRPESRFWDRHRATTPRIQSSRLAAAAKLPHSTRFTHDKENSLKRDANTRSSAPIPQLMDLAPPAPALLTVVPGPDPPLVPQPAPFIASVSPRKKKKKPKLSTADKNARSILWFRGARTGNISTRLFPLLPSAAC